MKKSPIILYAAVLAAVVSLSSCGAGPDDPPAAKTTPPVVSTWKPTPSSSTTAAPATSTGPAFPKGVPADARKHTKEGAEAFAGHVLDELNRGWTKPGTSTLDSLCSEDAKACRSWIDEEMRLKREDLHYDGDPIGIDHFTRLAPVKSRERFIAFLVQEKRNIVTSAGKITKTDQRKELVAVTVLGWTHVGWQLVDFGKVSG